MTQKKQPVKQAYTVLKPYEQHIKGDTVELFPRQAVYLKAGGFIAPAKTSRSTKKATS